MDRKARRLPEVPTLLLVALLSASCADGLTGRLAVHEGGDAEASDGAVALDAAAGSEDATATLGDATPQPEDAAPATEDAAPAPDDAAPPEDAGVTPEDATPVEDAAEVIEDAGQLAPDAGTPDSGNQPPGGFDLSAVTILASPDVRGFPITSQLTSIEFSPGTIHVDHTLRGTWPPVQIDPDGTTQEATIWIFMQIGGVWYGTGGERLRPNQTDKMLANPSAIGADWFYDMNRWGVMTGYVPQPGDLVGFMIVAGSTRSDNNVIVQERTGVVLVPFPPDNQTTTFPPFTWAE